MQKSLLILALSVCFVASSPHKHWHSWHHRGSYQPQFYKTVEYQEVQQPQPTVYKTVEVQHVQSPPEHHIVEKPQVVEVPKPYPVYVDKPYTVYIDKPKPVVIEKPKPVYVDKPYPVYVDKPVPVYVERPAPPPPPPKPVFHKEIHHEAPAQHNYHEVKVVKQVPVTYETQHEVQAEGSHGIGGGFGISKTFNLGGFIKFHH